MKGGVAMTALSVALIMAAASTGVGLAIGWLAARSVEGTARQPEAAGMIRTTMIIAIAFLEAVALYALVTAILLWTKM